MKIRTTLAGGAALLALTGGAMTLQTATAPPAAAADCGYYDGDRTAQVGSTGQHVREIQCILKKIDRGGTPSLDVDGIFGTKTRSAVVYFQWIHALEPDGIVGPKTWAALRKQPN
ncbi:MULTISPECIES: peptidoglycan-binding domain-containing protein [unclassified Streptomyces]|uniref:peptidoglycan-binding domain-containing protein n=1 Tax=unclassified Streptomyces TaxID=2593676 RepID=UPI001661E8A5|nr:MULTISPECIES: peptidoglycan-binding domain-containing protein [unclassified Streptomyces]MBD0839287.1 peptidoglycan-binding protein [Streptomyces sp. TRM68416]